MAYDSATDTALAGQAYKRALAIAQQNRTNLQTSFGLNSDGSMDNSAAGQLGSIYQGNLASTQDEHNAELADARKGFGAGAGGLGGKATASAHQIALQRQALGFQNANQQLGQNTQEQLLAGQDYENAKSNIGTQSAFDTAQTLAANPVLADPVAAPFSNPNPAKPLSPAIALAQRTALAKNPRAAQVAKNRF